MKVNISMDAKVTIVSGISKKTQKPWQAVRVEVGEWHTLIFPKSHFEMEYLLKNLPVQEA